MERSREHDDIAVALAEMRPAANPDFAAELDELVASGFQREQRANHWSLTALVARQRQHSPRRLLFAGGGMALAAIAVATIVLASIDSGSGPTTTADRAQTRPAQAGLLGGFSKLPSPTAKSGATATEGASVASEASAAADGTSGLIPFNRTTHREIERSAEIDLAAEPKDVADDSAKVFSAVHDARGIVLHSTTAAGRNAGADFDLLIPSAKLGDALAAISAIDQVLTRHEATTDITAPTVAVDERLQDSQAKIDGLLGQLATTESESEREAIEIELRGERHHAAVLRAHLDRLHRRSDYSRVSVRIEAGDPATGANSGRWGIDDAFRDAGRILGIAAGVTLVGLAVIAPLALLLLLAWLTHRLWLRTRRERALDA
jgi:hypothetical protein